MFKSFFKNILILFLIPILVNCTSLNKRNEKLVTYGKELCLKIVNEAGYTGKENKAKDFLAQCISGPLLNKYYFKRRRLLYEKGEFSGSKELCLKIANEAGYTGKENKAKDFLAQCLLEASIIIKKHHPTIISDPLNPTGLFLNQGFFKLY